MVPGNGYSLVVQPKRKNESGDGLALEAATLVGGLLGRILLGIWCLMQPLVTKLVRL